VFAFFSLDFFTENVIGGDSRGVTRGTPRSRHSGRHHAMCIYCFFML